MSGTPEGIDDLRVAVLGPVRAWRGGVEIDLGPAGRRAVLALLALARGAVVSRSNLIAALWDGRPPRSAVSIVHTYVLHLRRCLEPDRRPRTPAAVLISQGDGYALRLPPGVLDLDRFAELADAAQVAGDCGDPHRAAELRARALAVWAGSPAADVDRLAGHSAVRDASILRWETVTAYGADMLALGTPEAALPVLADAAHEHPHDEPLHALLIRAYHDTGRHWDEAATYRSIEHRLERDLDIAPGAQLQAVRPTTCLTAIPDQVAGAGAAPVAPGRTAQLPTGCRGFVGRREILVALDALVPPPGTADRPPGADGTGPADRAGPAGTTTVVVLSGGPGSGTSSVAKHWAHRVAGRFPHGQFYVDLQGHDPLRPPLAAVEALGCLLQAIGCPPADLPADLPADPQALAGRFRAAIAGRRILLLLDNARDAAQVRPLLPGTTGTLVLVTSRNRLTALVAAEGAHPVPVGPLSAAESRLLLAERIGADRVAAEPHAAGELTDHCGRTPLALAVVAARAAARPDTSLASLVEELDDPADRLDALGVSGTGPCLRTALAVSRRTLTPDEAELLTALGLCPGADLTLAAAASITGWTHGRTRASLHGLLEANLLSATRRHRYGLPPLIRIWSAERAARSGPERTAAVDRLAGHYLWVGRDAERALREHPPRELREHPPRAAADSRSALVWFGQERLTLVGLVALTHRSGLHERACALATMVRPFLDRLQLWPESVAVHRIAAAAADELPDLDERARTRLNLASAHLRLGARDAAGVELDRAEHLWEAAGDPAGVGRVAVRRAILLLAADRPEAAVVEARRGRELAAKAGDSTAEALSVLGSAQARLGAADADATCLRAVEIRQRDGNRYGEARAWHTLAEVRRAAGDRDGARIAADRATGLFQALGVPLTPTSDDRGR